MAASTGTSSHGELARELARRVDGEVRFDDGSRALYATDASNYRQVPIGVVVPRTVDDVIAAIDVCRQFDAPVLARGGGTSLAGQCCNTAVVIDMSKYLNRILEIDAARRLARVEPGCILDTLRGAAEQHGLTFGPDPATHDHNCLGGMIGNNSCGVHSVTTGRTADNVLELDVVTYDGLRMTVGPTTDDQLAAIITEGGRRGGIYRALRDLRDRHAEEIRARYPSIPRRVSGYNLDELLPENGFNVARALVGTEGTCVTVLGATLRLVPSPPQRVLLVLGYQDVYSAADHTPDILGFEPLGLEGLDNLLVDYTRRKNLHATELELLPEAGGWLLVEFGGSTGEEAAANAHRAMDHLQAMPDPPAVKLFVEPGQQARIWAIRESGLAATAHVPGQRDTWPGWEDAAVPPDRLGRYLREFRSLLDDNGYECSLYGHFGDGCVHCRIDFDLRGEGGIERYRSFVSRAADLVVKHGGSLSGEHGDGQSRAALLPKMFGENIVGAFRTFKSIWDPANRMNPGKVVDPFPIDANLRLGPAFDPPEPKTAFAYQPDRGSFVGATMRCVGVGKCRRLGGGVMCPSFMVTLEEKHSTRGRARLLFEMIHGDPLRGGWRSEAVRDALDLCLACKGCKSDCPVNVDMATYKAEFFSRYYKGRLRPRTAYSMGLIHWWCRAAALAPSLANALGQTRPFSTLLKAAGGVAQERTLPRFAEQTMQTWFRRRLRRNLDKSKVVLFPDTFNNHFHPEIGAAAVDVLETAGYQVVMPHEPVCCGRPLYAWGMLDLARRNLRSAMRVLGPEIAGGAVVVGLEPACMAAFRDELPDLFPNDDVARRLADNSFLLGEFLAGKANFRPPRMAGSALVHTHCHQHAVFGSAADEQLLNGMGLDYELLDAGCCGMAGAFGFEADHYEVAMKAGERVLLPRVRAADPDTMIVTDGYSCREQIAQATGRRALHLAEVLVKACNAA